MYILYDMLGTWKDKKTQKTYNKFVITPFFLLQGFIALNYF